MEHKVLTHLELAALLKIRRTKEYELRRSGVVVRGRDYFKFGGKIRYLVNDDFIQRLLIILNDADD